MAGQKRKTKEDFFRENDEDEQFFLASDDEGKRKGDEGSDGEQEVEETAEEKRLRLGATPKTDQKTNIY